MVMLSRCIENGGWFDNGLPRIAIVRADATRCWVENESWTGPAVIFKGSASARNRGALVGANTVRINTTPQVAQGQRLAWRAETIVPIIPPQHRPKRSRIRGFHVLWEVEQWANIAPHDPALLRHIRGDLWSVVATWDLTELERAVLSARG